MTENIATETNLKLTTPTDREIATTRVFDAPRGLVFDTLTIAKGASLFNVPMNDALASLSPTSPDRAARWASYLADWTTWNHVRTAA